MWQFACQNLITRPTRTLLAVVGLTIPILAILGLFSLTNGIRNLMGHTLARMNGLMVMRATHPRRSSATCRRTSPRNSGRSLARASWLRRSGRSVPPLTDTTS